MSEQQKPQPRLVVQIRSFPESNGKRNWTAILTREQPWRGLVGNAGGITIARGEYWNRVAYEAERTKFLLGQRDTEPFILDYGDDIKTPNEWNGEESAIKAAQAAAQRPSTAQALAHYSQVQAMALDEQQGNDTKGDAA